MSQPAQPNPYKVRLAPPGGGKLSVALPSVPAGVAAGSADDETSSVGIVFLAVFLFLNFSRVPELLLPRLYLPFLASSCALVVLLLRGRAMKPLQSVGGGLLVAFTVWLILALPFSIWRGGSFDLLRNVWLKSFMVFVLISGLTETTRDYRRLMNAIGLAGVVVVLLVPILGVNDVEGRLSLGAGVLHNPNEFGMLLLVVAPFTWMLAMRAPRWSLRKLFAGGMVAIMIPVVIATGSRGTLVALVAMALVALSFQHWSRWIAFAFAATLAMAAAVVYAPDAALERYVTILSTERQDLANSRAAEVAASSSEARFYLLQQSFRLTMSRPLFGYGPGQFQVAERDLAAQRGEAAVWHESHNSYTQVSSEAGVPALVFFLGALLIPMRAVRRLASKRSAADHETMLMARTLLLSFVGFAVGAFFSSVAYSVFVPTFVGMAEALRRIKGAVAPDAAQPPAPVTGWNGQLAAYRR